MSQQQNPGFDNSIWTLLLLVIVIFAVTFLATKYASVILIPWKYLRILELALTLQLDSAVKVFNYTFVDYGNSFSMTNDKVWTWYKFLAIPLVWKSWNIMQKSSGTWSIEVYLTQVYRRFPWLSEIFKTNEKTLQFTMKPPFIKVLKPVDFFDRDWPVGIEPIDYLRKYDLEITTRVKQQLGPLIRWKERSIEWSDPWAKRLAEQCYRLIPNGTGKPGDPPWKDQSWRRCSETHRYERTFALGMLQELRAFGVFQPHLFLYMRTAAIEDLKKGDDRSFILWRAVVAFGGNTAFPEAMGIIGHYLFERSMTEYLKKNPEDTQLVYRMRADPFVEKVIAELRNVEKIALTTKKTG